MPPLSAAESQDVLAESVILVTGVVNRDDAIA